MVHFLAENACFYGMLGHFQLNMTFVKEKSIVNCAGKYNVSAKEINHASVEQHHYQSSSFEREAMWTIAERCCNQLCHLCEDSEALGWQFLLKKRPFWGAVYWQNQFSRLNCQPLPKACHTYSESFPCRGLFEIHRAVFNVHPWPGGIRSLLANCTLDPTTSETVS